MDIRWMGLAMGMAVAAGAGPAEASCDTSTDEGAIAAYKKATGQEHDEKCIQRSTTFPGLVVMGEFAYDRGCGDFGVLVGCKWNPKDAAKTAMASAGWTKGDAAKRAELALAWIREIDSADIDDARALTTVLNKDKSLTVDYWVHEPVGMQPVNYYTHLKVTFSANGTPGRATNLGTESVPMNP